MINKISNYVYKSTSPTLKNADINSLKFFRADTYADVLREGNNLGHVIKKTIQPDGSILREILPVIIKKTKNMGSYVYKFIHEKKLIGGIRFTEWTNINPKNKYYPALKDYPKLGIVGDRIYIDMVENFQPEKYSGIAKLADKVVIEHCMRKNISPNIVFTAAYNSHAAHFLRGARFFWNKNVAGDINKIVTDCIKNTPKGEQYDTHHLGCILSYLPKNKISEYISEIFKNPLLK